MVEDSSSSSEFSESGEITDLDTTFGISDASNELCTPEKLAKCSISGITCSGYISRHDDTDTTKSAGTDNVSVDDKDDIFYESLKSKIQKDLALKLEENNKNSPIFPRTGLKYKRKRIYPFDDHCENLMRQFKESLIRDNRLELENTPTTLTPILQSYGIINYSNHVINNKVDTSRLTKPLKNRAESTTTRKSKSEIHHVFYTPKNVFRVNNIPGNTRSAFSLEVTSTISRKRRSAANNASIVETETKKVVYSAKFQNAFRK